MNQNNDYLSPDNSPQKLQTTGVKRVNNVPLMIAIGILTLFVVLIYRILNIGYQCCLKRQYFSGYLAYGIGLWLALQAMINMGVNAGMLPTKGLTLPLISYGGSSLLVNCLALGILFRIDYERRCLERNG